MNLPLQISQLLVAAMLVPLAAAVILMAIVTITAKRTPKGRR